MVKVTGKVMYYIGHLGINIKHKNDVKDTSLCLKTMNFGIVFIAEKT